MKLDIKASVCIGLLALSSCEKASDIQAPSHPPSGLTVPFEYDVPLADFSDVAKQLVDVSPEGLMIGEAHGQLASIALLEDAVNAALEIYPHVIILHEFTPQEAGLVLADVPKDSFLTFTVRDDSWPFWHENFDKRATHELKDYFIKISTKQNVELSYLWDRRLNPPPNYLKAHGFAERWKIVRDHRPEAYIIGLGGNYHASITHNHPLNVTNSMCRYLDEVYGMKPICMAVDSHINAPNENCPENEKAELYSGEDLYENWDYVVRRPSGCVIKAHWVGARQ